MVAMSRIAEDDCLGSAYAQRKVAAPSPNKKDAILEQIKVVEKQLNVECNVDEKQKLEQTVAVLLQEREYVVEVTKLPQQTQQPQPTHPKAECSELLSDAILEALFEQGVSCERLEALMQMEGKVWSVDFGNMPILPRVRSAVLQFMQRTVKDLSLSPEVWFRMVAVFDAYCLRSKTSTDALPMVCAAVIRLVLKFDDPLLSVDDWLLMQVPRLSQWISVQGSNTTPTTRQDLEPIEVDVIECLEWRMHFPTVYTWTSVLMGRFSILTQRMFDKSLGWIWQHLMAQMEFFVKSAHDKEQSPRHVSIGLFVLGLVSANLMPLNIAFPDDENEARAIFLSSQQPGAATLGDIADARYRLLCDLLRTVTGGTIPTLQQYCSDVVMSIQRIPRVECI